MAVEKAPYINYTELTSYPTTQSSSSEIPLFITKTNNSVAYEDINETNILTFTSYNKFANYYGITGDEEVDVEYLSQEILDLNDTIKAFFLENTFYGSSTNNSYFVPYIYVIDVGSSPSLSYYIKALEVSEVKRDSTVVACLGTEDISFMQEVSVKVQSEAKDGLLRIAYFGISDVGEADQFKKGTLITPRINIAGGYLVTKEGYFKDSKFYTDELYQKELIGQTHTLYTDAKTGNTYKFANNTFSAETVSKYDGLVVGYYKDGAFYETKTSETAMTGNKSKMYLDLTNSNDHDVYGYDGSDYVKIKVDVVKNAIRNENEEEYAYYKPSTIKTLGGTNENFDGYCERVQAICENIQSPRVALIEKNHIGKTIAKICSTPYYIEPGYNAYSSVPVGVFGTRTVDERDSLFSAGLIFNEDDYTLPSVTPRMCLGVSTAWGIENHNMRVNDALLHARRNVDHHIRTILRILAPQLKRNETSVAIRYLQTQIDNYLSNELDNGNIMQYSVTVAESEYNPYTLLVSGIITPVNSTLAIEFENTVGQPYAIASNYV